MVLGKLWPMISPPYILCLLVVLACTLGRYVTKKKQVYAAAAIACVPEGGNLASARERFRQDARTMLLQGYNEVLYPILSRMDWPADCSDSTRGSHSISRLPLVSGSCSRTSMWRS